MPLTTNQIESAIIVETGEDVYSDTMLAQIELTKETLAAIGARLGRMVPDYIVRIPSFENAYSMTVAGFCAAVTTTPRPARTPEAGQPNPGTYPLAEPRPAADSGSRAPIVTQRVIGMDIDEVHCPADPATLDRQGVSKDSEDGRWPLLTRQHSRHAKHDDIAFE